MTIDQHIQLWNAIGTWVAGLATFGAVLVSLHLARQRDAVKLRVYAGRRLVFMGDGTPALRYVAISATNLGERPVTILTAGWRVGRRKKARYCVQTVGERFTDRYPIELAHGKSATFMFEETADEWAREIMNGFIKDPSDRNLKTFTAYVSTSVGSTTWCKPEPDLLAYVREHYDEKRAATPPGSISPSTTTDTEISVNRAG